LAEIARAPIATGAGVRDKDEVRAFGRQPTDEVIAVTLSRPEMAKGDDLGVVVCGDIGDRHRVLMAIPADSERASLGPG
jgi:hypothetical protein